MCKPAKVHKKEKENISKIFCLIWQNSKVKNTGNEWKSKQNHDSTDGFVFSKYSVSINS